MKDYQFDDQRMITHYNGELWAKFIKTCEQEIQESGESESVLLEVSQSLDLIKAINSYRSYSTTKELFLEYPELKSQKEYVDILWKHFSGLSNQELSDLAMDMIHEVAGVSAKLS